jgi:transcriptional regulator GlxA family with amidase domain
MVLAPRSPRLVAVLAFEGVQLLDVAGPVQTFASANEIDNDSRGAPYRVVVVSRRGGAVRTSSGLPLVTRAAAGVAAKTRIDTLLIPGGSGVHAALKDSRLVGWVRGQGAAVRRIASVCTGAFLLAQPARHHPLEIVQAPATKPSGDRS